MPNLNKFPESFLELMRFKAAGILNLTEQHFKGNDNPDSTVKKQLETEIKEFNEMIKFALNEMPEPMKRKLWVMHNDTKEYKEAVGMVMRTLMDDNPFHSSADLSQSKRNVGGAIDSFKATVSLHMKDVPEALEFADLLASSPSMSNLNTRAKKQDYASAFTHWIDNSQNLKDKLPPSLKEGFLEKKKQHEIAVAEAQAEKEKLAVTQAATQAKAKTQAKDQAEADAKEIFKLKGAMANLKKAIKLEERQGFNEFIRNLSSGLVEYEKSAKDEAAREKFHQLYEAEMKKVEPFLIEKKKTTIKDVVDKIKSAFASLVSSKNQKANQAPEKTAPNPLESMYKSNRTVMEAKKLEELIKNKQAATPPEPGHKSPGLR